MITEEKKLEEIRKRVQKYIGEKVIITKEKNEFVDFFLKNSKDSLNSAMCLFDVSIMKSIKII